MDHETTLDRLARWDRDMAAILADMRGDAAWKRYQMGRPFTAVARALGEARQCIHGAFTACLEATAMATKPEEGRP